MGKFDFGNMRIPPRHTRIVAETFERRKPLVVIAPSAETAAPLLEALGRPGIEVRTMAAPPHTVAILRREDAALAVSTAGRVEPTDRPEGFAIRCDASGLMVSAADAAGLRWGVATAAEVLEGAGDRVPGFACSDWPDLAVRGVMIDLSRTSIESPEYVRRLIDFLAQWRCNMLQLYFEERFTMLRHPQLAHPLGYTAETVAHLANYAKSRGIELVPALATFGHAQGFLSSPEYRDLADGDQIYQFDPLNPRTLQFLEDMFDEWGRAVPDGRLVNASCDEAPYFGNNARTRAYIARHGVDAFIARHLRSLHQVLQERGFRMMIWADMLQLHPGIAERIPRDITLISWNYDKVPASQVASICRFRELGFPVIAAPAASRSAQVGAPRHSQITGNIPQFAGIARRLRLDGLLCCQWECEPRSPRLSEPGFALAMRLAWRGGTTPSKSFRHAVYARVTGREGSLADRLMHALSPDRMFARFKRIQRDPRLPKTYHLSPHELIATDPILYLRPRGASRWARDLARQYEDAEALATQFAGRSDDDWAQVARFAAACGLFTAWKRTRINEAGLLYRQAFRAWKSGEFQASAQLLRSALQPIERLTDLTARIHHDAPRIWTMDRHLEDPSFASAYGKRFEEALLGCRSLAEATRRAADEAAQGRDFTLTEYIRSRYAIAFHIYLRTKEGLNIVNLQVDAEDPEHPGQWRFDRTIGAFQPAGSRYDAIWIPCRGLPARLRIRLTRTQAPWSLERDFEVAVLRPPAPGGPVRRGSRETTTLRTEDYHLSPVSAHAYRATVCEKDFAIFELAQ